MPPLGAREASGLFVRSVTAFTQFLEELDDADWDVTTRCDPWTVKNVTGHVLGWNMAFTSLSGLSRQVAGTFRYRKLFGNLIDAQNEAQVDLARQLSPKEVIEQLRERARGAARVRRRLSRSIGFVPIYFPYLGGWQKASYLLDVIFLRDLLMHRSDCADATGRDAAWDDHDRRVMIHMVADWAHRTGAAVTIEFDDGDTYQAGSGEAGMIQATLPTLALHLGRRAARADVDVRGDVDRIDRWLAKGVPV